jgi:hypothetical protein
VAKVLEWAFVNTAPRRTLGGRYPIARSKSQSKSQRPQTRRVIRLRPATIVASRCRIGQQQETSRDGTNAPYKRGVTGSNPVAPTKFLQLDGLFETLIGESVIIAGNHRCMLPEGGRVPAAMAASPPATRARRRQAPALERHGGLKDPRRPASLLYACILVSLMAGVRPEEARAIGWP